MMISFEKNIKKNETYVYEYLKGREEHVDIQDPSDFSWIGHGFIHGRNRGGKEELFTVPSVFDPFAYFFSL